MCSVYNGAVDQTAAAGSDLQLECGAASLAGRAVVWRRAGRVLAVGKLLVRADGKGDWVGCITGSAFLTGLQ